MIMIGIVMVMVVLRTINDDDDDDADDDGDNCDYDYDGYDDDCGIDDDEDYHGDVVVVADPGDVVGGAGNHLPGRGEPVVGCLHNGPFDRQWR